MHIAHISLRILQEICDKAILFKDPTTSQSHLALCHGFESLVGFTAMCTAVFESRACVSLQFAGQLSVRSELLWQHDRRLLLMQPTVYRRDVVTVGRT